MYRLIPLVWLASIIGFPAVLITSAMGHIKLELVLACVGLAIIGGCGSCTILLYTSSMYKWYQTAKRKSERRRRR